MVAFKTVKVPIPNGMVTSLFCMHCESIQHFDFSFQKWLKRREKEEQKRTSISAVVIFVLLLFRFLHQSTRKMSFTPNIIIFG